MKNTEQVFIIYNTGLPEHISEDISKMCDLKEGQYLRYNIGEYDWMVFSDNLDEYLINEEGLKLGDTVIVLKEYIEIDEEIGDESDE